MNLKYKPFTLTGFAALALASVFSTAWSDPHKPPHAAKADFDRATSLLNEKKVSAAKATFRKAIEADPEFIDAHDKYTESVEQSIIIDNSDGATYDRTKALALATLSKEYKSWVKRYPRSAGMEYGLGKAYSDAEDPGDKAYLLKAIALNPKLAEAYSMLSLDAELRGDKEGQRAYMLKASELEPENVDYAFEYAFDFQHVDRPKYVDLSLGIVKRFPHSQQAPQALYWLGESAGDDAEKVKYWEHLLPQYPPNKFFWSANSLSMLFEIYARTQPEKAVALAQEMQSKVAKGDMAEWADNLRLAQNVVTVHQLFASKQYAKAKTILDNTKIGTYSTDSMMLDLLKAQATADLGDTKAAYEFLLKRYAKAPEDAVREALAKYADDLGKPSGQVETDAWTIRDANAKPAPSFNLRNYYSGKNISLADCRGKVVFLTFWFPGCGPCRGEMPYLEDVIKKFKDQDVVYLGINTITTQDAYVLPFMKGTHFSFTPLRGSRKFALDAYHVEGPPANFLIDQNGRVVYSHFWVPFSVSERGAQLMIQSMLDHKLTQ